MASASEVLGHVIYLQAADEHKLVVSNSPPFWISDNVVHVPDIVLGIADPMFMESSLPYPSLRMIFFPECI